jgi:protein gp37
MAENSKIEWCDHTVNLWWGCFEVNKACDNCYAKTWANRYHGPDLLWEQQGPRMFIKSAMNDLRRYQARAAKENRVYRVFMNSMSDLFEKSMPLVDHTHMPFRASADGKYLETEYLRNEFFKQVEKCPNLFFILLTKRPSNISKMVPVHWLTNPPANVIYMTSCPDQESLDTLWPQLQKVPGKRGLSLEPLLGPINLSDMWVTCENCEGSMSVPVEGGGVACPVCITPYQGKVPGIHWVICGGESGNSKDVRPMHPDWARGIRDQCVAAGVPFFFKQWGEYLPADQSWPEAQVRPVRFPSPNTPGKMNTYYRVGKHLAGSVLDGKTWKEYPI